MGILISKKIKHVIRRRIDDPGNNFLLLDTVINEQKITLGAIYGPNDDTNMAFFDNLKQSWKGFIRKDDWLGPSGYYKYSRITILLKNVTRQGEKISFTTSIDRKK